MRGAVNAQERWQGWDGPGERWISPPQWRPGAVPKSFLKSSIRMHVFCI
jgi:hypothetical protein